ncbi:MAG: hypothetical protein AB7G15_00480 [Alphaproteobacteria bacterium]
MAIALAGGLERLGKLAAAFAAPALIIGLVGCSTELQSVRVTDNAKAQPPTIYHLKRRVFDVDVVYPLSDCKDASGTNKDVQLVIPVSVSVVPQMIADPKERYQIPYEKLASGAKQVSFNITYYPDQTIKSVNADLSDKTAEVIEKTLETAAKIAGAFFGLGGSVPGINKAGFKLEDPTPKHTPIRTCAQLLNPETLKALAVLKKNKPEIERLNKEISLAESDIQGYTAALGQASSNHRTYVEQRRTAIASLIDKKRALENLMNSLEPALATLIIKTPRKRFDPSWDASGQKFLNQLAVVVDQETLSKKWLVDGADISPEAMSKLMTSLTVTVAVDFDPSITPNLKYAAVPADEKGKINGIVFREPVVAKLRISGAKIEEKSLADSTGAKIANPIFTVPQAGALMVLRLENGPFEENKVGIQFSNDGRIESFTFGATAALAALAGSAAKSAAQIEQILKSGVASENEGLKREKERLQLKKEIRDLKTQGIE